MHGINISYLEDKHDKVYKKVNRLIRRTSTIKINVAKYKLSTLALKCELVINHVEVKRDLLAKVKSLGKHNRGEWKCAWPLCSRKNVVENVTKNEMKR